MTNPVPGYSVSTAYGISGSMWTGCGYHTGVDIAAPRGTTVVAAISGQIRHRSYGSAFGPYAFSISPDPGEPFGDGEVFYAHVLNRLPDGTRVAQGQAISEVGDLGNATGPHLHFEFHPDCKDCWFCGCFANPQPVIDHGGSTAPPPASSGECSESYPHPSSNTVYLSKLKYGQKDSDSVWYLQQRLNGHPLDGGQNLPLSGCYLSETDEEVRLCQTQHGFGSDAVNQSYVGPSQADHLFSGSGITIVNDI